MWINPEFKRRRKGDTSDGEARPKRRRCGQCQRWPNDGTDLPVRSRCRGVRAKTNLEESGRLRGSLGKKGKLREGESLYQIVQYVCGRGERGCSLRYFPGKERKRWGQKGRNYTESRRDSLHEKGKIKGNGQIHLIDCDGQGGRGSNHGGVSGKPSHSSETTPETTKPKTETKKKSKKKKQKQAATLQLGGCGEGSRRDWKKNAPLLRLHRV